MSDKSLYPQCCPFCSGLDYKTIFEYSNPDQYEQQLGITSDSYYRSWVECSSCGLIYSVYSRSEDLIHKIYTNDYRSASSEWRSESSKDKFERIINLSYKESETKQRVTWIKDHLHSLNIIGGKCLDIGGGSGVFAYEFSSGGWKASVLDPDTHNSYLDGYGISVINSYLTDSTVFDSKFNFVSLVFVLEHINKPQTFLNYACSALEENGYLFVEVPSSNSISCRDKHDDVFNSCHLTLFNEKTLSMLAESCGLELVIVDEYTTMRNYLSLRALLRLPL